MRFLAIVFIFCSLVFIPQIVFADIAPVVLEAPSSPTPVSGAPAISLPLILNWEDVSGAESYYYQIIDVTEEILVTVSESGELPQEIQDLLVSEQKQYWHVKSCEDLSGSICGTYGDIWDFTYFLAPPNPELFFPANNATGVQIPLTLDWPDVPGAKSYKLFALPCLPWLTEDEECAIFSTENSEYPDDICSFTRNGEYAWAVASCLEKEATKCGPQSSPMNMFYTAFSVAPLPAPQLVTPFFDPEKPDEILEVSKDDFLSWKGDSCAYLYRLHITREEDGTITEFDTTEIQSESVNLSGKFIDFENNEQEIKKLQDFWANPTNLNKIFLWTVTPCWANPFGFGLDCDLAEKSETWKFQTAGKTPTLKNPENGSFVKIPFTLSWENAGGASYVYELSSALGVKTETVQKTKVEISYEPGLVEPSLVEPGREYSWKVKTCVDTKEEIEDKICGEWSDTHSFSTYPLKLPAVPINPINEGQFTFPGSIVWQADPGTSFYQYQISYISLALGETTEGCAEKIGSLLFQRPFPITQSTSFPLDEECTGGYAFAVRSCADSSCEFATNWQETPWTFTAQRGTTKGGLVPCGRTTDNPTTPYKEYESCGLKHAGFLLQNILDFVLWKVSLIVLAILAVFTGATTYFSFGSPDVLTRIRSIFRSYFYGVLILLFAWLIVNIIMSVFGFNVEFFGNWYEIRF